MLKEIPEAKVQYVITNEAGASVYSASKLATEEFPNFDVGQRSATSIARRVQDPLAELVKIDPKSIGVGQYQHDMNQKKLGEALTGVVEDSVNKVGVDLNTASASLLEYISGVSKAIAKNIVAYREENGRFTSRKELLKVAKLGPRHLNSALASCVLQVAPILWTLQVFIRRATRLLLSSLRSWDIPQRILQAAG